MHVAADERPARTVQDLGYALGGYSDRMKHVIEPTFNIEYITEMANQTRVPVTDFSVVAVEGREVYLRRDESPDRAGARSQARARVDSRVSRRRRQTYYTNRKRASSLPVHGYSGRLKPIDLSPIAVTARLSPTPAVDANARLDTTSPATDCRY